MNEKMTDVMLDMETFAVTPRALCVNLALVAFDPSDEHVGPFLFRTLDREQQAELKREVDPETVRWWATQPPEVRAQLNVPGEPLLSALGAVRYFLEDYTVGPKRVRMWSCGASFDLVLLATLLQDVSLPKPWDHQNERCYRTLKALYRTEYDAARDLLPRTGRHDALQDAIWQARVTQRILKAAR